MKRLAWLLICLNCFGAAVAAAAEPGKHVRVILDISKSMRDTTTTRGNDPKRLATLSTILLFDLTSPNARTDSFKVFPFEDNWSWKDPQANPPVSRRSPISAGYDDRNNFFNQIINLQYNSDNTYFYPGLRRAIDELKRTPNKNDDQRLIVLVTDGLPEPLTYHKEKQLLDALQPDLINNNISLYVLAFGKQANDNRQFFEEITRGVGEVFIDLDGDELLLNMLKIFAHDFGYDVEGPKALTGATSLDLEHGVRPNDAAVVVYSNARQLNLRFDLTKPGGAPANQYPPKNTSETGASYAMSWVSPIEAGQYGFQYTIAQGHYAVLRPTVADLKIESPIKPIMADSSFTLKVLALTPSGGRPPQLNIAARPNGPRVGQEWQEWQERFIGAPNGSPYNNGLLYQIPMRFPENPDSAHKNEMYTGRIEVVARSSRAKVGEIGGNNPYLVDVYPFLKITTHPSRSQGIAAQGPLTAGQQNVCDKFSFKTLGHLPKNPPYSVSAVLESSDPRMMDEQFRGARFSLDGIPLNFKGRGANQPNSWEVGRPVDRSALVDYNNEHEICINVGRPTTANPQAPLQLPVKFTLMLDPYKNMGGVMEDYTLELKLAEPGWLDRWRDLIFLGLFASSLLTLIWYTRNRPALAPDLGYAIAPEANPAQLTTFRPLQAGSWLARLLGFTVERPVTADSSDRPLAWVRPVDGELYRLRLAKGVVIEALDPGAPAPTGPGPTSLLAQHLYRLRADSGAYLFRMEYRSPDSQVG